MREKLNNVFKKVEAVASSKRLYTVCTLIVTVIITKRIIDVQDIGYSLDYISVYIMLLAMSGVASAAMLDLIFAIISGIAQRMQELI